MANLDEFLTVNDAAKCLGVSPNTVRNWDRNGKIPVYRHPINQYRLFKREDLALLLEQIELSGKYPTGWKRRTRLIRKPR